MLQHKKRSQPSRSFFIEVDNRSSLFFQKNKIKALTKVVLKKSELYKKNPIELHISLVSDRVIKRLNQKFHAQNKATDVLAFPMEEIINGKWMLGEVIVSVERAKAQAKIFGSRFREEVARYIVHGTLHLLGYRDHQPEDYQEMWLMQENVLKKYYDGI